MRPVLVVLLLGLTLRPAPALAADPLACAGYSEQRIYLESQGWWSSTERDAAVEHLHVSTCWPWSGYGTTLAGTVPLDLRLQLHHSSATTTNLRLQDWDHEILRRTVNLGPCEQCETTVHLDLDTRLFANGRREARISLDALDGGRKWYQSTGWQLRVDNPDSRGIAHGARATDTFTEARGWFEVGAHYINARFLSALPTEPLTGNWVFRWQTASAAASGYAVEVDPAFHAVPPSQGLVLVERSGAFNGTTTLDTTRLTNGWHRLVLRADSLVGAGRTSGLQVIGFEVRN